MKSLFKWTFGFVSLLLATNLVAEPPSGPRAALVVGNHKYEGFTLKGASQSLNLVEKALRGQGFQVTRLENLDEKGFKEAAEAFVGSVPTNGVACLYYLGLGANLERGGKHYNVLRPVKTSIASDNDYRSRGLNLTEFIEDLQKTSGARTSLLFLDACWQSPLLPEKGNLWGGMRAFEPAEGVLAAFAADSVNTISAPESDQPTPLAKAIAKHLSKFDESTEEACLAISKDLSKAWTGGHSPTGIGKKPSLPAADVLRDGKSPGEGFVNSVGISFRWCPAGSFTMGSSSTDKSATRDREPVQVTLTQGFWMGEHEVTQREYAKVLRKNPPLNFTTHKNAPMWGLQEAKTITQFCDKLNEIERKAGTLPNGWKYVCPTEAEWEYACRAGSSTAFSFGNSAAEIGRYGNLADLALWKQNPGYHWAYRQTDDGVGEALAQVGSYLPNAWGLRDMHGNVAEIVADHHAPQLPGGSNPLFRKEKNGRGIIRGGSWCSLPLYCESSFRNLCPNRNKSNYVGFRIALKKAK